MVLAALGVVLARDNRELAAIYLAGGLLMGGFLLARGMVLQAAVQGVASAMGAIALLVFGGEAVEG